MTPVSPGANAVMGLYAQPDLVLSRGAGCRVWDEGGKEYLDFTAGIAVTALGHGAPVVHQAVQEALSRGLIHTSNLFWTRPAMELAGLLTSLSFPGKVFFCNSGAEANEAALKFSRRWAGQGGDPARHEILAFHGAFHGRLFGTLATTDREAYQAPFRPLMPGVRFADVGNVAAVEEALASGRIAAVFIEPIQGEGGVRPVPGGFLRDLRVLCDRHDTLLVFDEIQCGLGRTGKVFAFQHAGVTPDMVTLAKPLAGGLPMGAVIAVDRVAQAMKPGDHGTTFGGGPLVASVALAVTRTISEPGFLARVERAAAHLVGGLETLRARVDGIKEVRGMGLMQGLVLDRPAAPVVSKARDLGLLVVSAGAEVVRLVPPLVITESELDAGLAILEQSLIS